MDYNDNLDSLDVFNEEEWRDCIGWPNYQVSSLGQVRRSDTLQIKIKHANKRNFYSWVALWRNNRRNTVRVVALVRDAFMGEPPIGPDGKPLQVDHKIEGNKTDDRLSNLTWLTQSENTKKNWDSGLRKKAYSNTLTLSTYQEIKRLFLYGYSQCYIAKYLKTFNINVHHSAISKIVRDLCQPRDYAEGGIVFPDILPDRNQFRKVIVRSKKVKPPKAKRLKGVGQTYKEILVLMSEKPDISVREIAVKLGKTKRSTQRYLSRLKKYGVIDNLDKNSSRCNWSILK